MTVAGITQVRNEIEVIDFTLWHHLEQGLDVILVSDNGSTDGTLEFLRNLSKKDSRIVLYNNQGPFHQEIALTFLAKEAHGLGMDWIVPFDGDEMWLSDNGIANDIKTVDAGGISIYLENFIQNTNHDKYNSGIYSEVKWKIPNNFNYATQQEVEVGIRSSVEIPWSVKHIIKLSENIHMGAGSHVYYNDTGMTPIKDNRFKIYQVPIRSYNHMVRKAENGLRIKEAGYPYGYGWEAHLWAEKYLNGKIMDEWIANSEVDGVLTRPNGDKLNLQMDDSVRVLYNKYLESIDV